VPPGPSAPWVSRIPTRQPVAFITIDDGWVKHPQALSLMRRANVPVSFFLSLNAIADNPGFFADFRSTGAVIEAHSLTHTSLKGKPYDFQRHEICGSADRLRDHYKRRPVLFRPPYGERDEITLAAARDCGMKAVLFWRETVDNGIVRFQTGSTIQRGDIILMHFRQTFVEDFLAALHAIARAGLTPALLEDYIA